MPMTLVGTLPGLAEGMQVRAEGGWIDSPKWGRQFRAERYVELVPATRSGIEAYLASGFIDGVGPKVAKRIVARFGEEALDVIDTRPERLREVPGVGPKKVRAIVQAFEERKGARESLVFLYDLGLTPGLANRIYKRYGDQVIQVVKRNPYMLAEQVHGIGFHKADQVARGLDISEEHPARIRAGAHHVLVQARGEGHSFVTRSDLVRDTAALTGMDLSLVDPAVDALAADGRVICEALPAAGIQGEAVYLTSLHEAEVRVARRMPALLGGAEEMPDIRGRIRATTARLGMDLARGQQQALVTAIERCAVIVTGGPGTGKTTWIRALLETLGLPPHRVALAAPTGRAAKRMAEATGHEARTIHRLLEFSPKDGCFQRGPEHPLDADLVVIDEASMIDLPLFDALVGALEPGTRLALVGDVDQLPPVGPGSPFRDMIRSGCLPVARLAHIFRQGRGSAIVASAHQVNRGEVPEVTPPGTPLQDFYFIEREDQDAILEVIEELVTRRIPSRFGLDPMRDIQVLSPMRNGTIGVHNLNARLHDLLNPDGEGLQVGATTFRVGDRVMQVRNDYERHVFNGDVGLVSRVDPRDGGRLVVSVDGQPVIYERADLDDLVLAYAVSVHKSQGSEYPAIVMPVTTHHYKMLQRNLLYTGITRGQRLVVLVGTRRALRIAVQNHDQALRNGLLATRLARAASPGHAS